MFSFYKLNISGPHPQKGQTVVVHYTGMPIIEFLFLLQQCLSWSRFIYLLRDGQNRF